MWTKLIIGILCLVGFTQVAFAQEPRLAQQYYVDGEYEKAATIYKQLYERQGFNGYYFERYLECLVALDQLDEGEEAIKQQMKRDPQNTQLVLSMANIYEKRNKPEEASKLYQEAISKMRPDQSDVVRLANEFTTVNKYDLAIQCYEKGEVLLKKQYLFAFQLGELYRIKDDNPKMVMHYLNSLEENPDRMASLQSVFQRYFGEEEFAELQAQLYERIQEKPNAIYYIEMLTWVFLQVKDYSNALRQAKALDKRLGENGGRIFRIGETAANDLEWDAAIEAYDYVVSTQPSTSGYFFESKRKSLACKRRKITDGYHYTKEEILQLETAYTQFLDETGRNRNTAPMVMELADLEALYLNNLPRAIQLLDSAVQYPGMSQHVQANAKIKLADYYLMQGEVWEATLLYSQVDKAFADDVLGHEARFRNARLAYFNGDFEWAQTQFKVLKESTSKLIANDALDMSVFISENLVDSANTPALIMYSQAELLVFQNQFKEAFLKLDSISALWPEIELQDDILWLKSQVFMKQKEYTAAAAAYQLIIEKYKEGIRADNSLFALAELFERFLNDKEKAKQLYEQLFVDFSSSTYAVEARKRFRALRGDKVQ